MKLTARIPASNRALEIGARRLRAAVKKIPGAVPLFRACRYVLDPGYRSERRLMRARPEKLFQPHALTSFDRHPAIFSFIERQLRGCAAPRILSYGCSTGEEAFSLCTYLPQAEIVGIDINPRSIRVCQKKQARSGDARMRFVQAATPHGEAEASYDAVFCLSVLRHGELGVRQPETCGHLIRFADFEEIVASLCRCLKPGGYLAILGSNFRFADTAAAAGFEPVFSLPGNKARADTPLYGPDEGRLVGAVYNDVVFRKRGGA